MTGFNATLTEPVDTLGRGGQIKEMELKVHPDLKEPLKKLSEDPMTTIIVLSGSGRAVLDKNFGEYNMWLAAENGMFLRLTSSEWMTTKPENLNMDLVDSVKILSLEDFKQEIYFNIFGQDQYQMHLLMLSKVVDLLRFVQLVCRRYKNFSWLVTLSTMTFCSENFLLYANT